MRSGDRNHASYVRSGGESKDLYMASKKEMPLIYRVVPLIIGKALFMPEELVVNPLARLGW